MAFVCVGLSMVALIAMIVLARNGVDVPPGVVGTLAATGLVLGAFLGLLSGFFDRPLPGGVFDMRSLNGTAGALVAGIWWGLFDHQLDASTHFMLLAVTLGLGVGNAVGLLFWRFRRQGLGAP